VPKNQKKVIGVKVKKIKLEKPLTTVSNKLKDSSLNIMVFPNSNHNVF
jgi:hypothetical protein